MNHIVATGDILSGMQFFGPFPDYWTALAWADGLGNDYLITILGDPDD
jgi:hypothetical protein